MKAAEFQICYELKKIPSIDGFQKLKKIRKIQIEFLIRSIFDKKLGFEFFSNCVNDIFSFTSITTTPQIPIKINHGFLAISNHLGINKLTKIHPADLMPAPNHQFEHPLSPLENDDPFILLLAPLLKSLSNAIDDFSKFELIFVFMELAPIYTKILHSINTVTIKRDSPNQYVCMNNNIYQKIIDANSRNKKPIVVIFPEGGTSGKYNLGGPYSLLEFKDGYRRLAKDLNLAILPIAIKVDSDINYFAHFGQFLPENGNVNDDRQTLINLLNFNNVS